MNNIDDKFLLSQDIPNLKNVEVESSIFPNKKGILEYREAGEDSSPTLLLLHGIGSSSTGYRAQLEGLKRNFRVIAWNAPGYGNSTHLAKEYPHYNEYVQAASCLLQSLGIKKLAGVIGSSWGSVVATCFAHSSGFEIDSLILSAPNVARKNNQLPEDLSTARSSAISAGLSTFSQDRHVIANRLLANEASDLARKNTLLLRDAVNEHGWTQAVSMLYTVSTPELLREIQTRITLIVGNKDAVAPEAQHAKVLQSVRPDMTYHLLEGVGHMPKLEAPTIFNKIVENNFS